MEDRETSMTIAMFLGGLLLLVVGAEILVRGAANLAERAGLSHLVIGLTVVAFGTSAPELAVSLSAGLRGQPDLAVGNVVGSNIFNLALILGLSALLAPIHVQRTLFRLEIPILVVSTVVLIVMLETDAVLSRLEGALLFSGIVMFTVFSIRSGRREPAMAEEAETRPGRTVAASLALIGVGLGMLVFGARWMVDSSVVLARSMGLSEATIGLTIVAAGTSLPELATSLVAARRGRPDIAIGNVVGSNIFNILCILGLSAALHPLSSGGIHALDLGFLLGTAVLSIALMRTSFRIDRAEGGALALGYCAYLWCIWPP